MLAKPQRHFLSWEVNLLFRKGKKISGRNFLFRFLPRENSQKALVVVSKKVAKSAVTRNRIRRRLFEIVRLTPIQKPHDMLLVVHSADLASMPAPELQRIVAGLLSKSGISDTITPKERD